MEHEIVNYCELDRHASKAYSIIHGVPETLNLGDITKVDADSLPKDIDLVTYGFPCQDISSAGLKRGFEHEGKATRSGLFFEALRIIEAVKPKYAIAENVKNLTSDSFRDEFRTVLESLSSVGWGYDVSWKVLNARDFGVPQNRERVFIVSRRKGEGGFFDYPEGFPLERRLKDVLEADVDDRYYLSDRFLDGHDISPALVTSPSKSDSPYIKVRQIGNVCPTSTRENPNQGRVYDSNGLSPALNCMEGGNRQPFIVDEAGCRIRRLTPKESFRLMGFEDADVDALVANGISDTQLYRIAGNSIVVDVLEALFRSLFGLEGKREQSLLEGWG